MRRALVLLCVVVLLGSELLARTNRDWGKVQKLKPGAKVLVMLWSGDQLAGRVNMVRTTGLSLSTGRGTALLHVISREDIRAISHLRGPRLPDPERWMLDGALIGGAVGLTAGAIQDATQGNNGRVLTEGFGGAGIGFFGSCAVLAGVGVVAMFRHNTLVYESAERRLVPAGNSSDAHPQEPELPAGANRNR